MFHEVLSTADGDRAAPAPGALVLHVAGRRWRVAGDPGCEVAACPAVAGVPGAPGWLAGLVVHKGEAMALVDPAPLLADASEAPAQVRARMFISHAAGFPVAFAVDDVDEDRGAAVAGEFDVLAIVPDLLYPARATHPPAERP